MYVCIYIYIYKERERETDRQTERQREGDKERGGRERWIEREGERGQTSTALKCEYYPPLLKGSNLKHQLKVDILFWRTDYNDEDRIYKSLVGYVRSARSEEEEGGWRIEEFNYTSTPFRASAESPPVH